MKNHVVSYYSDADKLFVFVGKDPIPLNSTIQIFELSPDQPLRIRLRPSDGPPQLQAK